MILTMGISIYTSRVILKELGVEDFGIYSVVGGVVGLLNFFTNTMATSYQRFFCVEIANGNSLGLRSMIGTALSVSGIWSIVVLLLAETLGLWLVWEKLVIPEDKHFVALVVYQLSILTFIVTLFQSIYSAAIISFERMNFFAYVSIVEAALKLGVAFSLQWIPTNRLLIYGILMLASHLVIFLSYQLFCFRKFEECKTFFSFKKENIKKLFSFSSWTLIGTFANVFQTQGASILLNLFFGPVVNAARALSFQIYTAVTTFTRGFQTAFSPTMIKTYENKDYSMTIRQLMTSSKLSFFLVFLLAIPIFLNTQSLLSLWLGAENVPEYTAEFIKWIILIGMLEVLASPIVNIIYAKGEIKWFQIVIGVVNILVLPMAYVILKLEAVPNPLIVYYVTIGFCVLTQFIRLIFLAKALSFGLWNYCREVILPVVFFSLILFFINRIFPTEDIETFYNYIGALIVSEVGSIVLIYFLFLSSDEKGFVDNLFKKCVRIFAK